MRSVILVHGADNFVGKRLATALSANDWAETLPVAAMDVAALRKAADRAQATVHCVVGDAGAIELGARALYGLPVGASALRRIVHLSSMTVYGSATGLVDEGTELRADLGPYSLAQRTAERRALDHSDAIVFRPGAEYGPGCPHWTARIGRLLLARRLGDLGAAGDGGCNLVYIDDLISAIQRALRAVTVEERCFNLADPSGLTWNDYFVTFAIALGAVPVRRIGARRLRIEGKVLAPFLKAAERAASLAHLPGRERLPPPISSSMLSVCRQDIQLSVARAERVLGMRWTNLDQGLRQAALWCRNYGELGPNPPDEPR